MIKKAFKIFGYTLGILLFLLGILAGLTQSKLFKDRLRVFLVSAITTNTNASISLGTIRGNFVTGFTIDSLTLRVRGEELISTGEIAIAYDLLSLPRKTIAIHSLSIQNPRIAFRRGEDSVWNLDKLGKPSTLGETSHFDWTIQMGELNISNGMVAVHDSISLSSSEHPKNLFYQVEYHDVSVFNLNLKCSGKYAEKNAYVSIKNLSFESERPQFRLHHLQGDFLITPKEAKATELIIETSNSHLTINASMQNVSLFDGVNFEQLQHKPTRISLLADNIDLNELKSFITPIDFLNGSAYIDLEGSGEFGNLAVNRLEVQTYNTSIKLRGSLQNLHRPEDLFINAEIRDSRVTPSDADKLLPRFHIPRFEKMGTLSLNCQFTGKPLNFIAKAAIDGQVGTFHTEAKINLEKELIEYDGSFQTRNFQIAKLFHIPRLQSFLTAKGTIVGSGTSLRKMTASASVTLDSSIVQGMTFTRSEVIADVHDHRLRFAATINSSDMKANITGNIDVKNPTTPSFGVEADIANLDFGKIFNDNQYKSKLSLHTSATGSGSSLDDLTGSVKISFDHSTFQTNEFANENVVLTFDQRNLREKEITLTSPIADIMIKGEFTLSAVIHRLEEAYNSIAQAIRERASSLGENSATSVTLKTIALQARNPRQTPFDLQYSCTVKNLKPLSIFLGGTPFNARGSLYGKIASQKTEFSFTCSTAVEELFVGTIEKGALVNQGSLLLTATTYSKNFQGTNISSDYFKDLSFDLTTTTKFAVVNKNTFDNTSIKISYKDNLGRYKVGTNVDSLFSLLGDGEVKILKNAYDFTFDTLHVSFGSLLWKNEEKVSVLVDSIGLHVDQLKMRRESERFSFQGMLHHDGTVDAHLAIQQLNLSYLGDYLGMEELTREHSFSGNLDLDVVMQGTLASPRMHLTTSCNDLGYRGKLIGIFTGFLNYESQNLGVEFKINNKEGDTFSLPSLVVKGTLPINLALSGVEKRLPEQPMNLIITSTGFELNVVDPLLTTFDEVQGKLLCDLRVEGTPSHPSYSGSITLSDVHFLFVPNNLMYTLSGNLEAVGDKINLVEARISNNPKDRSDGTASITGSLILKNFTIDSFDLTAHGQLLLMKETSRRKVKTMYGSLFAAIGPEGLTYRGSFDHSYLKGTIYINDANLIFPPTKEETYTNIETTLNYIVVDDTSKNDELQQKLSQQFYSRNSNGGGASSTSQGNSSSGGRTIWDGMEYDLEIETQGTTEIRMVFNQATNEELFADLNGRVVLQSRKTGSAQLIGEIAVSERSYYNFFKRFSASGTLKFVGPHDNPELNIKAKYEGIRRLPQAKSDTSAVEQKVVVTLDIAGTRYEPKLSMSMTVDGDDWASQAKGGDVQSDAIPFILTGKFRDDLSSREKSDILSSLSSSAGSSILYGLPSQMLSGVLSNFLRNELGFIRSAELTYSGGSLQESADLRLSGELGRAYWRFGGKIFNDIGNANVSFQLSMGEILSTPKLRNLFIELERKVEGTEVIDQKKLTNAARIFYKFSF